MLSNEIVKIARRVICDILEGAAFVFTDELYDEIPLESWAAQGVKIEFEGSTNGEIHMWAPPEFLSICAANMLGIEETDGAALKGRVDAGKEILNMVAGLFITESYGDETVFHLSIPEELKKNSLLEEMESADSLWIQAEGQALLFLFKVENV